MSDKEKKNQEQLEDTDQVLTGEEQQEKPQPHKEAPGDPPSPDGEYAQLKDQYDELKDKYLRLFAEFDNYKKRTIREKMEMMKNAAQDTMLALLPVLDDFDRAKKNAESEGSAESFSEGVKLVYQKLYATLKQRGLEPMDTDGEIFDPELHEAITEIPSPSEELKGRILDTIEKGYLLNGKIIRHAKVVVGK